MERGQQLEFAAETARRVLKRMCRRRGSAYGQHNACACFAVISLVLLLSACQKLEPSGVLLDLVAGFPTAEVSLDSTEIDFGTPEARTRLREGWSIDDGSGETTFVWGTGEHSRMELFVSDSAAREVEARLWPFSFKGAPRQHVYVRVNDQQVANLALGPNPARYTFHIPAGVLHQGTNNVEFHYYYAARPRDLQPPSHDMRALSVAWSKLEFRGRQKPAPPSRSGTALIVPAGTRVAYYVWLTTSARLEVASLKVESEALDETAAVRVEVSSDSAGILANAVWREGQTEPIEVPVTEPGPVRISLWGIGRIGTSTSLESPRLLGAPTRKPGGNAALRAPVLPGSNVLLYVIDTLRADHLGAYGYTRNTSPEIDRMAATGITFLRAHANAPWTRPSVASILTGLDPSIHGTNKRRDILPAEVTTLAETLRASGYQTAGIITNGNISRSFGFAQGFEVYEHLKEDMARPGVHVPAEELNRRALEWLDARDRTRPFFLYLHATDPHGPYTPSESFRRRFASDVADPMAGRYPFLGQLSQGEIKGTQALRNDLVDLYDAEIAYVDQQFGRLLRQLDQRGLRDNLLIVLTADHGEEFLDHGGWEHGKSVFAEMLNVPLVFRLPGAALSGTRSEQPAALVDVVPTLLGRLGLASPAGLSGRDLFAPGPHDRARAVHALLDVDHRHAEAIESHGLKLIRYRSRELQRWREAELFDHATDPSEQTNLVRKRPVAVGFLRQELRALKLAAAPGMTGGKAEIQPELERTLRALGYLGDDD